MVSGSNRELFPKLLSGCLVTREYLVLLRQFVEDFSIFNEIFYG